MKSTTEITVNYNKNYNNNIETFYDSSYKFQDGYLIINRHKAGNVNMKIIPLCDIDTIVSTLVPINNEK